jgi:hypothetical protein
MRSTNSLLRSFGRQRRKRGRVSCLGRSVGLVGAVGCNGDFTSGNVESIGGSVEDLE